MHLLLGAEDSETELHSEIVDLFPEAPCTSVHGLLLETDFAVPSGQPLPHLAFVRQFLPNARRVGAASIRSWAAAAFEAVVGVLPDDRHWSLHIEPHFAARTTHRMGARAWHSAQKLGCRHVPPERRETPGRKQGSSAQVRLEPNDPLIEKDPAAGRHRCHLIRDALVELLHKKRRHLLRQLRHEPTPFTEQDSLVQLLLTAPDAGFISVASAPLPFEQRHLLSPFPAGCVRVAADKTAPSRAFAKLVEAELRLGRSIRTGETCVDLGAAPGSWSFVAAGRGAQVIAVDHSPLREDLMRHPCVRFQPGDAFRFQPPRPVDWLLCDLIAPPERVSVLLREWLRRRWCRHFVVTLKLKDAPVPRMLAMIRAEVVPLTRELFLTRLCTNKREVCAFGATA